MTAPDSLPLHALTVENLASASPDLLRQMVKVFAEALMSADAAACNAAYGQGRRITGVRALVAVGVIGGGYREIVGIDVATVEDGAGWLAFLSSVTARGLAGVELVVLRAEVGAP
jgi:transposase-like protein